MAEIPPKFKFWGGPSGKKYGGAPNPLNKKLKIVFIYFFFFLQKKKMTAGAEIFSCADPIPLATDF